MEDHTDQALDQARRMRRAMSLPEVMLWQVLRTRPAGLKFRRQHPVGYFVADFYCAASRMIVEVDGIAHDMGDRPERDAKRDAWLAAQGIEVIRITASDVLRDLDGAVEAIVAACGQTPPPSAAKAAATSPNGGGSA